MSSRIRESKNYTWSLDHFAGREATGTIFKGTHKKTGHLRFIEVFNRESQETAEREYEVLKKLDHPNVIKLLALEQDIASNEHIMIMEYCNGGSLLSILKQPENAYGMPEKDFLYLLHDIESGLKHLQDHNIVHRNINPRNIQIHTEDGRHVFKLNNFGAARQLGNGGMCTSFYGEPEYQCPEVFERDVLKSELTKPFSASMDLWSVGVTLYQAATGHLPFQPYGGPRKNARIMYQMISDKTSGCISAIQNSQDGPISWSHTLPQTCNLSLGLQNLLCPLLAAILESKSEHAMTFEAFFDQVSAINRKFAVLVFSVIDFNLLHIYCDPDTNLSEFHHLIELQTDNAVVSQHLFYESRPFTHQIISSYLWTSPSSPIFLFSTNQRPSEKPHPILPKCPEVAMHVSLSADLSLAKQFAADCRYLHRLAAALHMKQQILEKAAKLLHFVLCQEVCEVNDQMERFASSVMKEFLQRISLIFQTQSIMWQILNPLKRQPVEVESKLNQHRLSATMIRNEVEEMRKESTQLYNEIIGNTLLPSNSFEKSCCQDDQDYCLKRMKTLICDTDELEIEFARKMQWKEMNKEEKQIHIFDKKKLTETFSNGLKWVNENCFSNLQQIYMQTMDCYSRFQNVSEEVEKLKVKANDVAETLRLLTNTVDEFQAEMNGEWLKLCSEFEVPLLPQPSLRMCQHQQEVSRHKINGGEFVFKVRRSVLEEVKKILCVNPLELPESSKLSETSSDTLLEKSPAMWPTEFSETYAEYKTSDEPATLTDR